MKELAKILYGSQNYHLDIPTSDRDYRIIVSPSFDDLYYSRTLNKEIDDHNSYMDVRTFTSSIIKGNPNAVELLYSVDSTIDSTLFKNIVALMKVKYGDGYLRNVWYYFTTAIIGMCIHSEKKGDTPKTRARVEWYYNFVSALIKNNYRLNDAIFHDPSIWTNARAIREEREHEPGHNAEDIARLVNENGMPEKTDVGLFQDDVVYLTKELVKDCME